MGSRTIQRVGILTGGGDCPGLNGVLRAFTRTAILQYGWQVLGIIDGYEGLLEPPRTRPLDLDNVKGILPLGGTILGTTNRCNPFDYVRYEGGQLTRSDRSAEVLRALDRLGLDALCVVGGDGSLNIAKRFAELGVPLVGVPKTIDNDLSATDVTFGYHTAVQTATEAIDRLHTTTESHHRVMIVEVMGRDAGWIALESGLAGAAAVILIPEIPFDLDRVAQALEARSQRRRDSSIVVVAEGAAPRGGQRIYQPSYNPAAQPRLGGIGPWLVGEIERRTGIETRAVVLGHLQRGGTPTAFDRNLATRFGAAAARLIAAGGFGRMVALHGTAVVDVALAEAVGVQKRVPVDGELVRTARDLGICFGD